MAINNNLEPGAFKYKESSRNIIAGMKKALYICQALTAVILFTWWDRCTVYIMFLCVLPSPVCWVARLGDGMGTVDALC